MFRELFHRSRTRLEKAGDGEHATLIRYLVRRVGRHSLDSVLQRRIDAFLSANERQQATDLPSVYLAIEYVLLARELVSPRELREYVRLEFLSLSYDDGFSLILEEEEYQSELIGRYMLMRCLDRSQEILGDKKIHRWRSAISWLDAPEGLPIEIVGVDGKRPSRDTSVNELLVSINRNMLVDLSQSLGDHAINKIYRSSYTHCKERYGLLSAFSSLGRFLPPSDISLSK